MKKFFPLLLLAFIFLMAPEISAAYNNFCLDGNPTCCIPPPAIMNGGGCPAGEVWIGGPIYGRCLAPVACPVGDRFNCTKNTCDNSGNSCNTTNVETNTCCAPGQVPIRDSNSTSWICGDPGSDSVWKSDANGPYVDDKQVGIGVNSVGTGYSLTVRADGTNSALTGAILAMTTQNNGIGLFASGRRAGGVFEGEIAAIEARNESPIRVLSDIETNFGTIHGFFDAVKSGEVRLGSSSNHDINFLRNGLSYMKLVNTGTRRYAHFPQGVHVTETGEETGFVIIGDPNGWHMALDPNDIMAKSNATTIQTLQLNRGGNVRITPTVSSATNLCINGSNWLAICSSSLRYKNNIRPLESLLGQSALKLLQQFRPVGFDWIEGEKDDFGLVAEEVEEVFPQGVTYKDGQIQGVKYDQLTALLIAAVQEQQDLIEIQGTQIKDLKNLVCLDHPEAEICNDSL